MVGTVLGRERTFCNVPTKQAAGLWMQTVNEKASEETWAHMGMFDPKENPGYDQMSKDATGLIAGWLQNNWYESSAEDMLMLEEAPAEKT